jgi:hypothetical protein
VASGALQSSLPRTFRLVRLPSISFLSFSLLSSHSVDVLPRFNTPTFSSFLSPHGHHLIVYLVTVRQSPHEPPRYSRILTAVPMWISHVLFTLSALLSCLVDFLIVLLQRPHCPSISRVLNCAEHFAVYLPVNLAICFAIDLIIISLLSARYSPGEIR